MLIWDPLKFGLLEPIAMLITPGSDWEQLQDHMIHLYDLLHRHYYKSPSLQEKFDECIANKNHYTGEKK